MELTAAQARQLLLAADAGEVSDGAAAELAQTLELYAGYVSEEAVAQARDSERKIVTKDDVIKAEQ